VGALAQLTHAGTRARGDRVIQPTRPARGSGWRGPPTGISVSHTTLAQHSQEGRHMRTVRRRRRQRRPRARDPRHRGGQFLRRGGRPAGSATPARGLARTAGISHMFDGVAVPSRLPATPRRSTSRRSSPPSRARCARPTRTPSAPRSLWWRSWGSRGPSPCSSCARPRCGTPWTSRPRRIAERGTPTTNRPRCTWQQGLFASLGIWGRCITGRPSESSVAPAERQVRPDGQLVRDLVEARHQ